MTLASIRIITADLDRLVQFYETVTKGVALRHTPDFAELVTPGGTIAIGHVRTLAMFGADIARPAENHSIIIEFRVPNVDAAWQDLQGSVDAAVQEPTTMPWGNRSLLIRDPDGNLVNLFAPVTAEAKARFAGRS